MANQALEANVDEMLIETPNGRTRVVDFNLDLYLSTVSV